MTRRQKSFTVQRIDSVKRSPKKGSPYLECLTDEGLMAFWGSENNIANISDVQGRSVPFTVKCECFPSNWEQHVFWVPELAQIEILRPEDTTTSDHVSTEALAKWRREIVSLLNTIEKDRADLPPEGLAKRIWRLSHEGHIPREVAALMNTITEMRNTAEYEAKVLSSSESAAVRNAWKAIQEWGSSQEYL